MAPSTRSSVVVVGAGISGLTAAWTLLSALSVLPAQERPDVVVLDSAASVGGKLALVEVGGLTVDAGAEALLARRPEAVELVRALGLGDDLVSPSTTSAGVWSRGQLHDLPAGTLMGVPSSGPSALGVLTPAEAARVDEEPGRAATPVEHDVSVAAYVASRVGQAVVDRLVEPLLGGVYAGHADRLSLQATVPALWSSAQQGTSLLAAVRTAARRDPSPGEADASTPAPAGPVFAGVRGGVGRLPLALAEQVRALGGAIRTGTTARAVRRGPLGWEVVIGSRTQEQVLRADAVVVAVPARAASRLLAGPTPGAAHLLGTVELASMALVTLVLPGAATLVPAYRSGALVPPVDGHLVKAVTLSSVKWGWLREQAGPDLVVRLSVGRHGEERDLQRSDDELVTAAAAELATMLGQPLPVPLDARVVRWGGALPQYAVGHVDLVERVRAGVAEQAGLAVCGGYLEGLGVPACIAAAQAAAATVRAHLEDLATTGAAHGRTMGR